MPYPSPLQGHCPPSKAQGWATFPMRPPSPCPNAPVRTTWHFPWDGTLRALQPLTPSFRGLPSSYLPGFWTPRSFTIHPREAFWALPCCKFPPLLPAPGSRVCIFHRTELELLLRLESGQSCLSQSLQTASSLLGNCRLAFQKFLVLISSVTPQECGKMPWGCSFSRASSTVPCPRGCTAAGGPERDCPTQQLLVPRGRQRHWFRPFL